MKEKLLALLLVLTLALTACGAPQKEEPEELVDAIGGAEQMEDSADSLPESGTEPTEDPSVPE